MNTNLFSQNTNPTFTCSPVTTVIEKLLCSDSRYAFKGAANNNFAGTLDKTTFSSSTPPPNAVTIAATVFLEGAYNGTNRSTNLNANLPINQPYTNNGHAGAETANTYRTTTALSAPG